MTPKPMLHVGDQPLIERLVQQLRQAGIASINISTHYKGDQISAHFGNGEGFGIAVEYWQKSDRWARQEPFHWFQGRILCW